MKILVVEAEHFAVPGVPTSAHFTPASADAKALELVNVIRADVGLPAAESHWQMALVEAQCQRLREQELFDEAELAELAREDTAELAKEADCDVWITEHDVDGVPELPAALTRLLDAADKAAEVLFDLAELHTDEEDAGLELQAAAQAARASAALRAGEPK